MATEQSIIRKDGPEAERELLQLLLEQEGIEPDVKPLASLEGPQDIAPLSASQRRLWFLDRLQPGSDFYSILLTFDLRGNLDVNLLERSFMEFVRRHSAMRTRFVLHNGDPIQKVEPEVEIHLPIADLRSDSPERKIQRK